MRPWLIVIASVLVVSFGCGGASTRPAEKEAAKADVKRQPMAADAIKKKRMEMETLRTYLQEKKATTQLEGILTIEKELSRVRGELDQLEGRLRRLKDLSALATATVTLQEKKDYEPEQAGTFGEGVQ